MKQGISVMRTSKRERKNVKGLIHIEISVLANNHRHILFLSIQKSEMIVIMRKISVIEFEIINSILFDFF